MTPSRHSHSRPLPKLYFYINTTSQLQIIRAVRTSGYDFEKVIFPGQRFLFEGLPGFDLKVYINDPSQNLFIKKIPDIDLELTQLNFQESRELLAEKT